MMTTGSDFLSPCHSKSVTCWILLILALCLPVCGQAVEGRKVISPVSYSSRTGNSSATLPTARVIYNDKKTQHTSAAASSTRSYRDRGKRGKTQYTSPAASSSTRSYRDRGKRGKTQYTPHKASSATQGKKGKTQHTPPKASSSNQVYNKDKVKSVSVRPSSKNSSLPPPVVGAGLVKGSAYAVGPEDVLAIEVFDNPELKGEYIVSTGGDIVFPLIGQVNIAGKTLAAIKNNLTHLLEKDYLYNPIVSVDVRKYLSKQVKIMGNIHKPGVYYLEGPTRLFDLLTRAGGISKQPGGTVMSGQKAHITRADLKRGRRATSTDHTKTYYVDLHQLLVEGKDETNVYLQSGDVIFIPGASSFHVIGEVKKAGSFSFEEGITLFQALSLAGGLTEKGDADAIVIKRVRNGRGVEMKANMETLLAPNDTVYIPEDKKFIHVVGEVKHADSFPYEQGITLLNAVNYAGGTTQQGSQEDAIIKRLSNGTTIEMKGSADTVLRPNDTVVIPKARSIEVVGEVKRPGSIPYESGMTLLKAIDLAGGATLKGSSENAIIKRLSKGRVLEMKANMYTSVQPNDTIFVPEVRSFHVTGEVVKPGSFLHEPRLTLLKAIAMAGGATKKGDPEDSIIKRLVNGKIKEIEATPSTLVQPDDVIEVPLSFW